MRRKEVLTQEELRIDADFPALLVDESGLVLFWLEDNGQRAYSARLGDNALREIHHIGRVNIGSEEAVDEPRRQDTACDDGDLARDNHEGRRI